MVKLYTYAYRDQWDTQTMRWSFKQHTLRVEVIEELPQGRTRVKFLQHHVDGRTPGTKVTVQTKSLKDV